MKYRVPIVSHKPHLCLAAVALGLAALWLADFADVGVMVQAVLNAIRALFVKGL